MLNSMTSEDMSKSGGWSRGCTFTWLQGAFHFTSPTPIHQSVTKLNLQQSDQTHLKRSETRAVASLQKRRVFKDQPPSCEHRITRFLLPDLSFFPKRDQKPEPWQRLQPNLCPKLESKAKGQGWTHAGRITMDVQIYYIGLCGTGVLSKR